MRTYAVLYAVVVSVLVTGIGSACADELMPQWSVTPGQSASYSVAIRNTGPSGRSYTPDVRGLPDGVTAAALDDGGVVNRIEVSGSDTGSVLFRLTAAENAVPGAYRVTVVAGATESASLPVPVRLVVTDPFRIAVEDHTLSATVVSGQGFDLRMSVSNTGSRPVDALSLSVDAPAKWIVEPDPANVRHLQPGERTVLRARVLVPASQEPTRKEFSMLASSADVRSPAVSVSVDVQKSLRLLFIALAIIAVVPVVAVGYVRRKGRR